MKNNLRFSGKIFWQYLVTYVIIFIVPFVLFSTTVYMKTYELAYENSENYYMNKLYSVRLYVDNTLSDIESVKHKIQFSKWLKEIFFDKIIDNKHLTGYFINEVRKELGYLSLENLNILDILVKLDEDDTVYCSTGIFHRVKNIPWKTIEDNTDCLDFSNRNLPEQGEFAAKTLTRNTAKSSVIVYSSRITNLYQVGTSNRLKGDLRILLNMDSMKKDIRSLLDMEDSCFIISNNDEEILDLQPLFHSLYSHTTDKTDYKQFAISSKVSGFRYVLVIPPGTFMQRVHYVRNYLYAFMALAMLVCFVLSLLFSKINYNPVRELVRKLYKPGVKTVGNEFNFINEKVTDIMNERDEFEKEVVIHKPYLQQHFLKQLVENNKLSSNIMVELEYCNICFENPLYCVVLADISSAFNTGVFESGEKGFKMVVAYKKTVQAALEKHDISGYLIENDLGKYILLLNCNESVNLKEFIESINREYCSRNSVYNLLITPSYAVGNFYESIEGYYKSYKEALEALKYKILEGEGSIIFYSDIKDRIFSNYYYPIADEINLISSIKECNFPKAEQLLDKIFNENIYRSNLDIQSARCIYYELVATLIKTIQQVGLNPNELIDYQHLNRLETLFDIHEYLKTCLNNICDIIKQKQSNELSDFEHRIIDFVKDNCFNHNLSLNFVSDNFDITGSYVSQIFKNKFGISYSEFVNRKRIEKALQLMKQTGYKLGHVLNEVGYDSSDTFRRNFIKYTGRKPSEYKQV